MAGGAIFILYVTLLLVPDAATLTLWGPNVVPKGGHSDGIVLCPALVELIMDGPDAAEYKLRLADVASSSSSPDAMLLPMVDAAEGCDEDMFPLPPGGMINPVGELRPLDPLATLGSVVLLRDDG